MTIVLHGISLFQLNTGHLCAVDGKTLSLSLHVSPWQLLSFHFNSRWERILITVQIQAKNLIGKCCRKSLPFVLKIKWHLAQL